jgi:hypothetical protein
MGIGQVGYRVTRKTQISHMGNAITRILHAGNMITQILHAGMGLVTGRDKTPYLHYSTCLTEPLRLSLRVTEPGGASLDTAVTTDANTTPIPTEGTASVKLIGMAKKAAAAEPEALEPRAEGIEVCHE